MRTGYSAHLEHMNIKIQNENRPIQNSTVLLIWYSYVLIRYSSYVQDGLNGYESASQAVPYIENIAFKIKNITYLSVQHLHVTNFLLWDFADPNQLEKYFAVCFRNPFYDFFIRIVLCIYGAGVLIFSFETKAIT